MYFYPAPWWLLVLGIPLLAVLIVLEIRARKKGQTVERRSPEKRGG